MIWVYKISLMRWFVAKNNLYTKCNLLIQYFCTCISAQLKTTDAIHFM